MRFRRRLGGLLIAAVLLFSCACPAFAAGDVDYELAFAVHSIRDDSYLRHVGPDPVDDVLYDDEYYVLYLTVHNYTGAPLQCSSVDLSIDGEVFSFGSCTVNSAYSFRLRRSSMQRIGRGQHVCTLTVNGESVYSGTFTMPREWSGLMDLPEEQEVQTASGKERSPYIAFWTGFQDQGGYTEYAIDIHTDHIPYGTYICPISWWMDLSALEDQYEEIWNDYAGAGAGYCGLQVWDDGTRGVIMTIWDVFCRDASGRVTQVKADVLYPENATDTDHDASGEGSFVHYSYPYDWEPGKDYRFLLQQSEGADGTVLMTLWICDIQEDSWTRLFCFDTGLKGIWIRSAGGFLENYIPAHAAEVRTMEFWNVKARMRSTGEWTDARSVQFGVNASIGSSRYAGSYNFGEDADSCWIITSGISGLCTPNDRTGPYPVPITQWGAPYYDGDVDGPAIETGNWNTEFETDYSFYQTPDENDEVIFSSVPIPPEKYEEFLRSGDYVLDLSWADMDYESLMFWPSYWSVFDVDGNGIEELIVQVNGFWLIYTITGGNIRLISSGSLARDMAVSVCPEQHTVCFAGAYTSWSFMTLVRIENGVQTALVSREKEDPGYVGFAPAEIDPSMAGTYIPLEQNEVAGYEPYA